MVVTGAMFEALVLYDQDGVLRPQLAKALPDISADKLTYTFELREDVLFHNGQPMTSADVKYSFESMLDPKRAAVRRPSLGGWTVMFTNNAKPPFDDVNFRRAMAYAIDRDAIAQKAFYNLVAPCTVPAPPGSWWYDETADHIIRYDVDKARGFLKASKYPDGAEFDMTLPATPYLLDVRDAAIIIQSQLQAIGIKPRLKLGEPMVVIPQAMRGEHDCLLLNNLSPGEPTYLLTQNFVPNMFMSKVSGYANPRVDQLLHVAYAETDQARLKPVYAELMTVLAQDSPYIWLGFFESANLWRGNVRNFKVNQGVSMMLRETSVT
jgi:peptide/nickel transport system substrate-binding protein